MITTLYVAVNNIRKLYKNEQHFTDSNSLV